MNMPLVSGQGASSRIDQLLAPKDDGPSPQSVAALESKLEEEKAQRKIERFFWVLAVTILGDCILFKFEDAVTANLFISILSLVMLIGCAKWLEVPWVYIYLARMFNRLVGDGAKVNQAPTEEG